MRIGCAALELRLTLIIRKRTVCTAFISGTEPTRSSDAYIENIIVAFTNPIIRGGDDFSYRRPPRFQIFPNGKNYQIIGQFFTP
ncbi:hypothetical protein MnTg02_03306 [bacterium MnTg02]|nr:hypothetical protein MnTg02_03306 [bacterium MnTg02]